MSENRALDAADIREIGEALYGSAWQGAMAKALGVPRQSVSYYLKSGGVNGAQAAGIIGLVARMLLHEGRQAQERMTASEARRGELAGLLARFDGR